MDQQQRAKRDLKEAVAKVKDRDGPEPPAPANPELTDSQARGGGEMASEDGRTKPRG
jgi:hypothetical protein